MLFAPLLFLTSSYYSFFFFFFNDTATTEIYTLSLHDALPIFSSAFPSMPDRSLERETAPIVRLPATRGAPSQEPGEAASSGRADPRRRASSRTSLGNASGPRRSASWSRGSSVRAGPGRVS